MLNLMTSMSHTGYGVVGSNIAKALTKAGMDICLWPYGNVTQDKELAQPMLDRQQAVDPDAPCLNIWHQFDLAKRIGNGTYYAWPFFELNKFTDQEKAHLRVPHHIIVSSGWAKEIVNDQVPSANVYVVPCGVDTSIFKPVDDNRDGQPYTFFNIGKWEKRKGHDVLIRAFDKAFDIGDSVHLVMMPYNPFLRDAQRKTWVNMYINAKLSSKVTLLNPVKTHQDVANIINSCDCGVFPSHAEGWNLELLEAMACGKPVIATRNSAHTEFCNDLNSFLIDTPETEVAYDGIFFHGQGEWAEIDIEEEEQLIEYMRYCYRERPTNHEGLATTKSLQWDNSAEKLMDIFLRNLS